ncbi:MAG: ATP-binding protein [Candidatus Aenigmarchaeota archaeon]|nr:ATP-binding protein [Candidatus Aenigmarchaeota archaeon]
METNLKEVLSSWLTKDLPELIEREYPVKLSRNIVAIIGPRRAGKTYFLFQIVKELLNSGYERENIAYIDFEDIRLKNLKPKDYSTFIKVLHEVFKEKNDKLILLLDEIQNLEEWQSWIRTLHNSNKYYIWVTGSSSKLSSKEIATQLRGRYSSLLLLPFSFKEFLKYKSVETKYLNVPEVKGKLLRNLREYLSFGGFPDVVKEEGEKEKIELLKIYKETIFYRDIVERFSIKSVAFLENFLTIIMDNFGNYISLSKLENYFKSIGLKKSKKTLSNYAKYFENAFFLFTVEKFGYKTKERVQQPKKVFPIDLGFYNLIPKFSENIGRLAESLVAISLYKSKFYNGIDFFYWKDYQQNEVDFVLKEGLKIKQLIQVTYASSKDEIEKRELKALLKASKLLRCKNLLIITWDYEDEIKIENKKIVFKPLWKWLLNISF